MSTNVQSGHVTDDLKHRASVSLCHPAHSKWVSTGPAGSVCAENLVGQAFARNSPIISIGRVWTSAGTGTQDILYGIAPILITRALTGSHTHGVGATNGRFPHGSGLELPAWPRSPMLFAASSLRWSRATRSSAPWWTNTRTGSPVRVQV